MDHDQIGQIIEKIGQYKIYADDVYQKLADDVFKKSRKKSDVYKCELKLLSSDEPGLTQSEIARYNSYIRWAKFSFISRLMDYETPEESAANIDAAVEAAIKLKFPIPAPRREIPNKINVLNLDELKSFLEQSEPAAK